MVYLFARTKTMVYGIGLLTRCSSHAYLASIVFDQRPSSLRERVVEIALSINNMHYHYLLPLGPSSHLYHGRNVSQLK